MRHGCTAKRTSKYSPDTSRSANEADRHAERRRADYGGHGMGMELRDPWQRLQNGKLQTWRFSICHRTLCLPCPANDCIHLPGRRNE
jgi:hypothetical protein